MTDTKTIAGVGTGALATPLIVWIWQVNFPETPMPAEVAGTLGVLIGGVFAYVSSWLPKV